MVTRAISVMMSDQDILYTYNVMSPDVMIRVARLSLFSRIITKALDELLKIVHDLARVGIGWPVEVKRDLDWLCTSKTYMAASNRSFDDWAVYVSSNAKYSRSKIKTHAKTRYANSYCPIDRCANSQPIDHLCGIEECKYAADSKQKLALHQFKIDGIKSIWKLYVGDMLSCPICLKHFHTRERVLNHVRYRSEVCRHSMVLRDFKWTQNEIDAMDALDCDLNEGAQKSGKRRHTADMSVVQLSGPLEPILLLGSSSNHHALGVGHNIRI